MSTGFSAITTVVSPAVNYDLTDLATAKTELGIMGFVDDAWLTQAVSQVSRAIASYVKRVLVPEVVQDAFDFQTRPDSRAVRNITELQLTRWPIITVASVVQTNSAGVTTTLVEGVDFRVNTQTGTLLRLASGTGAVWEAAPITVSYMAGFGSKVTEAHPVPATPYALTVAQSAAFSCDLSVSYANGTKLVAVSGAPSAGQYTVAAGVYTFAAADSGQALTFAYGVKSTPGDLVEIMLRLVTARYSARGRDPAMVQRETPGVGTERWWVGAHPGQVSPFSPEIEYALSPYMMPVIA